MNYVNVAVYLLRLIVPSVAVYSVPLSSICYRVRSFPAIPTFAVPLSWGKYAFLKFCLPWRSVSRSPIWVLHFFPGFPSIVPVGQLFKHIVHRTHFSLLIFLFENLYCSLCQILLSVVVKAIILYVTVCRELEILSRCSLTSISV